MIMLNQIVSAFHPIPVFVYWPRSTWSFETVTHEPWPVWLSWLEYHHINKSSLVRFLIGAHTSVASLICGPGTYRNNQSMFVSHINVSLCSSFSLWKQCINVLRWGFLKNHSHKIISERKICLYFSFLGPPIPATGSITVPCNLCIFRQSLHVWCPYIHTYDIVLVFKVLEAALKCICYWQSIRWGGNGEGYCHKEMNKKAGKMYVNGGG